MSNYYAKPKDFLIALGLSIFTLPLLFFFYTSDYESQFQTTDIFYISTPDGLELQYPGKRFPIPRIIDLAEPQVGKISVLLQKKFSALAHNDFSDFSDLIDSSEALSFSESWNSQKNLEYRNLIQKAAKKITYYGWIAYGGKKIALTCLQGEETIGIITPLIEEISGPKLSFVAPDNLHIRYIDNAFNFGKVVVINQNQITTIPTCKPELSK
jgi:hypothetical protein